MQCTILFENKKNKNRKFIGTIKGSVIACPLNYPYAQRFFLIYF